MSKQVDVLAVLDETYGLLAGPAAEQLEAARAAIADLIEASARMNALAKGPVGGVSQADKRAVVARMDAALAAVQGEKA